MNIKKIFILILLVIINNIAYAQVHSEVYYQPKTSSTNIVHNNNINILVKYRGSRFTVESLLSNINNINYTIAPPPDIRQSDPAAKKDAILWEYLFGEEQLSQEGFIKLKNSPYSLVKQHFKPNYIILIYTEARQMPNGYQHKEEEYILIKMYDVSNHIGQLIFADSYTRKDFTTYRYRNDFGSIPQSLNRIISNL